uniref:Uncharacterized protein n=1 Tax=Arundo donax TaxID=35708 RepID=A0A0A9HPI9_ARUDO
MCNIVVNLSVRWCSFCKLLLLRSSARACHRVDAIQAFKGTQAT